MAGRIGFDPKQLGMFSCHIRFVFRGPNGETFYEE